MTCKKCNTALIGGDFGSILQRELNNMWICQICKCCRGSCCACQNKN